MNGAPLSPCWAQARPPQRRCIWYDTWNAHQYPTPCLLPTHLLFITFILDENVMVPPQGEILHHLLEKEGHCVNKAMRFISLGPKITLCGQVSSSLCWGQDPGSLLPSLSFCPSSPSLLPMVISLASFLGSSELTHLREQLLDKPVFNII